MINGALFRREMKISVKLLLIFGAIMTLYVTCIIWMYEPETVEKMNRYIEEQGYVLDFSERRCHHEIYLSDVRRCKPENLKTVIRHPVRRE